MQIIIQQTCQLIIFQQIRPISSFLINQPYQQLEIKNKILMSNRQDKRQALDSNIFVRLSHLTIFLHIFNVLTSNDIKKQFAPPRFKLFPKIKKFPIKGKKHNQPNQLFKNILYTFKFEIMVSGIIAIIFASLNLMIPVLIKHFLHFMHDHSINRQEIQTTTNLLQAFVFIQILRIIFGQHAKRLFHQIAIKIQSALAIKIVSKGLKVSNQVRNKISQSDMLHLQNVDLKLVFTMFKNMHLAFEAPFTILIAIFMLFNQNSKYGFIGVYWFLIAFLLQRELDGRMTHCNDTKLGLIQDRSKVNYMILSKIKEAKISGHQDLLIEKNNDYFREECHDHQIFYRLSTLYDIILLVLPTIVIVTIALYDLNEADHINVQQVYVLLSLLGICYNPMKAFRTLTISMHDGTWSLNKIQDYLYSPNEQQNHNLRVSRGFQQIQENEGDYQEKSIIQQKNKSQNQKSQVLVVIQNNVVIENNDQHDKMNVKIKSSSHIQINLGERVVVMGRKGHGVQVFMQGLVGKSKIAQGIIWIAGKVAYLGQNYFFRNTTVRQNIRFFDETIKDQEILKVYKELGLDEQMKLTLGIQANIDDQYKYTKVQLHKIALARILCSKADIYILNNAFLSLPVQDEKIVNNLLRQKQREGKIIIMNQNTNNYFENTDKILIFQKGITQEYGTYFDLKSNSRSKIHFFEKNREHQSEDDDFLSRSQTSDGIKKIQNKIKTISKLQRLFSKKQQADKQKIVDQLGGAILLYSIELGHEFKKKKYTKIGGDYSLRHYFIKFLTAIKFQQFVYIFLIILAAELTHIFVHFYIGHLQEQHGQNNYLKFKNMIIVQVVLTILLSGIIYLEGEVASSIAIIQGNTIYQNSLTSLTSNKISWFSKQYSIKIANRFNHDYEQIFIALHAFLNIYKNFVILIATIYFVTESKQSLVIMTLVIFITYFNVYYFLRKVQRSVVQAYDDFRYPYVRVLQQSFDGAQLIKLSGVKKQFLKKSKQAYTQFASYRIAQSYTQYGQQILCDLISLIIFSIVLGYGLNTKVSGNKKSIALLGTMIHLLVGVFDVLKNIVKQSVNLETFFNKNIMAFMIIGKFGQDSAKQKNGAGEKLKPNDVNPNKKNYNHLSLNQISRQSFLTKNSLDIHSQNTRQLLPCTIQFDNVILRSSKYHQFAFQTYPLTLKINQGQKILLFQKDSILRSYLVYGLTKNLPMFFIKKTIQDQRTKQQIQKMTKTIKIGGRDIINISYQQLSRLVQVYMQDNFCFQGTIKDNLQWKNKLRDKKLAYRYCDLLRIQDDIPQYKIKGLNARVQEPDKDVAKKLMLVRILLINPRVIIIKDTSSLLGGLKIVEMLTRQLNNPTIIKISSDIQAAFDIERVVYMKHLHIIENRTIAQARQHKFSQIGRMLRQSNIDGYLYANLQTVSLFRAKYNTQYQN